MIEAGNEEQSTDGIGTAHIDMSRCTMYEEKAMPMHWIRRGAALLAVGAVVAIVAAGAAGVVTPDNAAHAQAVPASDAMAAHAIGPWETVAMPAEVRAVLDRAKAGSTHGDADARLAAPAQDAVLVHVQDFEGQQFPPDGWEVVDRNADPGADAVWAWGRQTCENKPDSTAGAWSNGGGTAGDQLTCWTPYADDTDTWIVYAGIDATGFAGGIRVLFDAKVDPPANEAFRMCWASASQMQPRCRTYNITGANLVDKWWYPSEPLVVETAGHSDVAVMFWYVDEGADGTKKGAIVDNVIIEGFSEQVTATATVAQNTPVPTGGPTQPPVPAGRQAFMPITFMKSGIDAFPPNATAHPQPTSVPKDIDVKLGLEIDDETGDLVAPGEKFQFGIMQLGRMITWQNQQIGTEIRWQWYLNDQEISGTISGSGTIQVPAGRAPQEIIQTSRDTGDRLPIQRGTWRCDVWIGDVTTARPPDASAVAVISDDVPPGKTAVPTPVPTLTPVPTETLEPGTWTCNGVVSNGDFEQGPTVGWTLRSNLINSDTQEPIPIEAIIVDNSQFPTSDPAPQGEWFARYPGVAQGQIVLYQTDPLEAIDVTRHISSTIEFLLGIDSKETPNGTHNDTYQPVLISEQPDGSIQYLRIIPEPLSEENLVNREWQPYSVQLTDNFWTTVEANALHLGFMAENDAVADTETYYAQDTTELNICLRNASMSSAERRARDAAMPAPIVLKGDPVGSWTSLKPATWGERWVASSAELLLELAIDR